MVTLIVSDDGEPNMVTYFTKTSRPLWGWQTVRSICEARGKHHVRVLAEPHVI